MARMSRLIGCTILLSVLSLVTSAEVQRSPWAGTWRGALTTPEGVSTAATLTIVHEDGVYSGVVTGLGASTEVRLTHVRADDAQLIVEGTTETDFGPLGFVYRLTRDNDVLVGGGPVRLGAHGFEVSLELKRARRAKSCNLRSSSESVTSPVSGRSSTPAASFHL